MKKNKKLLFLVTEDWYFISHRLSLALAAKKSGFDVIVVTHTSTHSELIRSHGIKLLPILFSRSFRNPLSDLKTLYNLFKIYRKEAPDIIHHVALKPVLYGSFVKMLTNLINANENSSIVINALTGLGYVFTSNNWSTRLLRFCIRPSLKLFLSSNNSHLILQNNDDLSMFLNDGIVSNDHVSLIRGSGVDVTLFKPLNKPNEEIKIMLVGRMLKDKGVEEFVAAAKLLKDEIRIVRFILVGDPDYGNPSSIPIDVLKNWNSKGIIEWWGKREDMISVYSQADIVVLPSYREGLPKVLLEAAACGLPIVATDVPGCREIILDGINGILVPVKNSVALADAIKKLIEKPELRSRMGVKGRELVENEFSQDKIIKETLELYEKVSTY
jgi:glycosyltransferase involved in cell wall biosynthesis